MLQTLFVIYTILVTLAAGWYIRKYKRKKKKADATINRIKDAVISFDNNWRYTFINDAALATHPLGRSATLGKVLWDIHPELVENGLWDIYHEAKETGKMAETEIFIDAFESWFSVKAYPSDTGLTVFYQDITESKQIGIELGKSEEKYRTLFYKSPLPVWLYDFETLRFIDVNEAAVRHYGYSRAEFLSMTIKDIRPEEDIAQLLEEIAQVKANSAGTVNSNWRHLKKNGEIITVDATAHSFEHEGRTVRIVIVNDITEKTIMERKLLENQMKLNEAQAIGHLGYWDVDLNTSEHTWSAELYRIFGFEAKDREPSVSLFLSFIHPDDKMNAENLINTAMHDYVEASRDFRFVKYSGELRHGYIEWKFEYNSHNIPIRLFGILQDITERKKAEESTKLLEAKIKEQKIQQQKKISKAIMKAQEQQKNHIAQELHDNINQILFGAKFHLGIAGRKDENVKELIKNPVDQITRAMDEIHLLCRNLVTPLPNLDLGEVLRDFIQKLNDGRDVPLNIEFHYALEFEVSDDLKMNIYRIVQELLHNILKHAEAKNINIAITGNDGYIHLIAEDDGKGFDMAVKRNGLGISNIMHRAEAFNGKVDITSAIGTGCKTEVLIPYNLPVDDAAENANPQYSHVRKAGAS